MLRKLVVALSVALLLAGCASDDESTPDTASGGGLGAGANTGMGGTGIPSVTTSRPQTSMGSGSNNPTAVQQELVSVGDRVYFGTDQYDLSPEARDTLDRQAAVLIRSTAITVTIEGHCDERGTTEYNLALGERRANSVRDYLIALGISPSRIQTISYGELRPAVPGSTEAAWAKNRRAVTVAVGSGAGS